MLKGLVALHSNGICHGCLRLAYTYISSDGIIKLDGFWQKKFGILDEISIVNNKSPSSNDIDENISKK